MLAVDFQESACLAGGVPAAEMQFVSPILCLAQPEVKSLSSPRLRVPQSKVGDTQETAVAKLNFESLVDAHYEILYRFAMSLTRSESDASDLVQETFLAWATKGHQLINPSKVKSWLFTTLHRRFLMTKQRSSRFPHFELTSTEEELPHIEPESAYRLDVPELLRKLATMESPYRAAVALFYLEDYSYQEIAAILEIPMGTVKSRIARGLAKLRELVDRPTAHPRSHREMQPMQA
jgi:RNA polymerase sigma factor (sigma-70 family)